MGSPLINTKIKNLDSHDGGFLCAVAKVLEYSTVMKTRTITFIQEYKKSLNAV